MFIEAVLTMQQLHPAIWIVLYYIFIDHDNKSSGWATRSNRTAFTIHDDDDGYLSQSNDDVIDASDARAA